MLNTSDDLNSLDNNYTRSPLNVSANLKKKKKKKEERGGNEMHRRTRLQLVLQ